MDSSELAAVRLAGQATIDHEIATIDAAIELVASGAGTRVTLTGLRFGAELQPRLERLAASRNVRLSLLWPLGDGPADLVVEAVS